jgi:hypothetical protein
MRRCERRCEREYEQVLEQPVVAIGGSDRERDPDGTVRRDEHLQETVPRERSDGGRRR